MQKKEKEAEREERIIMEAIVDAYGPEEQAMGWYYYLQDKITFPFKARCFREVSISPLCKGESILVDGMSPEEDCSSEMFVMAKWQGRSLALPLSQLEALDVDEVSTEAIGDWRYWVDRGYEFG